MNEILKLIETVDPEDSETLDEIDARVWCWIEGLEYETKMHTRDGLHIYPKTGSTLKGWLYNDEKYTRSRDTLKSIRPEGCPVVKVRKVYQNCGCEIYNHGWDKSFVSAPLPTEELAELHAIIQAIQWSRENE